MCWKLAVTGWLLLSSVSRPDARRRVARSPGSFSPMKLGAMDFGWRVSLPDAATPGGLLRVPISELRASQGVLTTVQKSAEGILGQAVGKANEALQSRKAEKQIGRAGNEGRRPERLRVAIRTDDS